MTKNGSTILTTTTIIMVPTKIDVMIMMILQDVFTLQEKML